MHLLNVILLTLPCKSLTRQTFTCPFQEENSEAEKCTGHLQELREKTTVRPIKRQAISLFKQDAVTRSEYLRVAAHHDLSPPSIWHEGQKEPPRQGVDGGLGFRDGTSSIPPARRWMLRDQAVFQLPATSISTQSSRREIQQHGLKHFENNGSSEDSGKMAEWEAPGICLLT